MTIILSVGIWAAAQPYVFGQRMNLLHSDIHSLMEMGASPPNNFVRELQSSASPKNAKPSDSYELKDPGSC